MCSFTPYGIISYFTLSKVPYPIWIILFPTLILSCIFWFACSTLWIKRKYANEKTFQIKYQKNFSKNCITTWLFIHTHAHQSCIYLITNTVILWNITSIWNKCFLLEYIVKCNLFMWCAAVIFSIITPVFSVTWSFRNHSNMLICCSRYVSYYY